MGPSGLVFRLTGTDLDNGAWLKAFDGMVARMNRHFLPLSLGIAGIALVLAAFGTGNGDTAPADDADEGVVLGETDLAEQTEIWRNKYRRMTPGDEPLHDPSERAPGREVRRVFFPE